MKPTSCAARSSSFLIFGVPCEKPVPTGCSMNRILDRLVQLNSLGVGRAWPQDHVKGCKGPSEHAQ